VFDGLLIIIYAAFDSVPVVDIPIMTRRTAFSFLPRSANCIGEFPAAVATLHKCCCHMC